MTSAVVASPAKAPATTMTSVFSRSTTLRGSRRGFVLAAAARDGAHDPDDERGDQHEEDDREQRGDLDTRCAGGLTEDPSEWSDERLGHRVDRRNEALLDVRAEQSEGESHEQQDLDD